MEKLIIDEDAKHNFGESRIDFYYAPELTRDATCPFAIRIANPEAELGVFLSHEDVQALCDEMLKHLDKTKLN